ncbi:hypothetical protein A2U01_0008957 [Trifolium medium]|uniref:RNase H type-1 domain-containing protein n=1 Tax=Trifolium medium TaxID=97028 RepID=A0A392MKN8_9FABA|nr:hypothetical protein [Trifolium medium]
MVAELWGAFEGLKLAWEKGYKLVELQMDAKDIDKVLNREASLKAEELSLCSDMITYESYPTHLTRYVLADIY